MGQAAELLGQAAELGQAVELLAPEPPVQAAEPLPSPMTASTDLSSD